MTTPAPDGRASAGDSPAITRSPVRAILQSPPDGTDGSSSVVGANSSSPAPSADYSVANFPSLAKSDSAASAGGVSMSSHVLIPVTGAMPYGSLQLVPPPAERAPQTLATARALARIVVCTCIAGDVKKSKGRVPDLVASQTSAEARPLTRSVLIRPRLLEAFFGPGTVRRTKVARNARLSSRPRAMAVVRNGSPVPVELSPRPPES